MSLDVIALPDFPTGLISRTNDFTVLDLLHGVLD